MSGWFHLTIFSKPLHYVSMLVCVIVQSTVLIEVVLQI